MFDQAAHLWGLGRATGHGFLFDLLPLHRQWLRAEFAAGLGHQLAHPNLLGPLMLLVEILGAAFPARGLSQPIPPAGPVRGALIQMRIDKGFGQRHRMAPALFPVLRQPSQHQLHKAADQIGTLAGRQNQQAGVIDQKPQARAPLFLGPADEAVARFEVQRRRTPASQRQPLAPILAHIAQVFAYELAVFQIVMFRDELIESIYLIDSRRPYQKMRQNLLFVGGGLAEASEFFLFHAREHKKMQPSCPAKSFNAFFAKKIRAPKDAPYRFKLPGKVLSRPIPKSETRAWASGAEAVRQPLFPPHRWDERLRLAHQPG